MKVLSRRLKDGTREQEDEWEQQSDSEDGELECIEGQGMILASLWCRPISPKQEKKKLMEKRGDAYRPKSELRPRNGGRLYR